MNTNQSEFILILFYQIYNNQHFRSRKKGHTSSMTSAPSEEPSASSRLMQNNQGQPTSRIQRILGRLDIFSYVPQPHTYPVSTTKSKIASLVFLIIIVSYLTYDFVKFMTANQPIINSYDVNVPTDKLYQAPLIAFGFVYGPSLNMTLNDPSYFTFTFNTIESTESGNSVNQQKIPVGLIPNCNPEWFGLYNNVYRNMTCLNSTVYFMNVPSQNPNSISQRLSINTCVPGGQITCKNATQLSQMTSGGRFVLIINLPAGFDYQTGTVDQTDYSVEIYHFFLVPGLYNRINIQYYVFEFTTYPNYFTKWKYDRFSYMQSYQPVVRMSNVSIYNTNILLSVTFALFSAVTSVQVQYQTFIARLSEWGALASLIMGIFGLCCLTYNKSKFLQKNPTWQNFDEAMRKKQQKVIEIEMEAKIQAKKQNGEEQQEEQQQSQGGITAIRKKVEGNLNQQ